MPAPPAQHRFFQHQGAGRGFAEAGGFQGLAMAIGPGLGCHPLGGRPSQGKLQLTPFQGGRQQHDQLREQRVGRFPHQPRQGLA